MWQREYCRAACSSCTGNFYCCDWDTSFPTLPGYRTPAVLHCPRSTQKKKRHQRHWNHVSLRFFPGAFRLSALDSSERSHRAKIWQGRYVAPSRLLNFRFVVLSQSSFCPAVERAGGTQEELLLYILEVR